MDALSGHHAAAAEPELAALLAPREPGWSFRPAEPGQPAVLLIVGVNGTGKTTTIGKIAARERAAGCSVLLAAGDTFRAAAIDQLRLWGQRAGASVVAHAPGADPSAVIYDALELEWRKHDMVWGRLNAAEILIRSLVPDGLEETFSGAAHCRWAVTLIARWTRNNL